LIRLLLLSRPSLTLSHPPFLFLFPATAPPHIYTLSLHDALPIFQRLLLLHLHQKRRLESGLSLGLHLDAGFYQFFLAGIVDLHVDRKSTRLNSSHVKISYAVFCLKKKKNTSTINSVEK